MTVRMVGDLRLTMIGMSTLHNLWKHVNDDYKLSARTARRMLIGYLGTSHRRGVDNPTTRSAARGWRQYLPSNDMSSNEAF